MARLLQIMLRLSLSDIFGRVKAREIFADDFVRGVSLHVFRAGIPRHNFPERIEQINCVFVYSLDEHPELLFARAQFGFGRLSFAQIAHDIGEPDQFSLCVAHRRYDGKGPKTRAAFAQAPALLFDASLHARAIKFPARFAFLAIF